MERNELHKFLESCLHEIDLADLGTKLPEESTFRRGKVRDIFDLRDHLIITTTDRISAFDRVLTTIPCKGEILNRISLFWFESTRDLIRNHLVDSVSARSVLVRKCEQVPIEVVVRGYLTGSAWRDYQAGKNVSGIELKPGLRYNEQFEQPLITPSTKEESGIHDVAISRQEIISRGIVKADLWEEIEDKALALFRRGTQIAQRQGLILVDTKYEFGLDDGQLALVDEIHTPDSSRYWYASSYQELYSAGERQAELDKEYLRHWLMERGFKGDGLPPEIPDDVRVEVAWKYAQAFERITGQSFAPEGLSVHEEVSRIVESIGKLV